MTTVEDRPAPTENHAGQQAARKAMIDSQLRTSGINAPFVLERMAAIAREDFVPATAQGTAYMDRAIALGDGRFLGSPLVQGMMLQESVPVASDVALVIDGGSNYLPELLRPLVAQLTVITPAEAADGAAVDAGTTLVLVDGAAELLPAAFIAALPDGCRIISGLVQNGLTRLALGRKAGGALSWFPLAELGIPLVAEFAAPKTWSF